MKIFKGIVVSAKTAKTVAVKVETLMPHPLYKKLIRTTQKFLAHDEIGVKEGDTVEIKETRPLSARKHFMVVKKIDVKAKA